MAFLNEVYGIGQGGTIGVLPVPIQFTSVPASGQKNYAVGQLSYVGSGSTADFYIHAGAGVWYEFTGNAFGVSSVTGTAAQILATPTTGAVVLSLIGPYTPATYAAGALLVGNGASSIATLADVATGQVLMSGGVGVAPAYSGSPSVSGSLTAATTVTATLGAITATNGNFVSSTAGKGLQFAANIASGAASGPVVLNSRAGAVTFTGVSIAAAADLTLTMTNSSVTASTTQIIYSMQGATTGSALSIKSVTNSSGSSAVVITNGTGATTTTADITLTFLVVN